MRTGKLCIVTANLPSLTSLLLASSTVVLSRRCCHFHDIQRPVDPFVPTGDRPLTGIASRMIPTEDASARKREIEEKLKQVRHGWRGRKHHKPAFHWNIDPTGFACCLNCCLSINQMSLPADSVREVSQCFSVWCYRSRRRCHSSEKTWRRVISWPRAWCDERARTHTNTNTYIQSQRYNWVQPHPQYSHYTVYYTIVGIDPDGLMWLRC